MKTKNHSKADKGSKQKLLREYFLNASLIALLKKAGEETARLEAFDRDAQMSA